MFPLLDRLVFDREMEIRRAAERAHQYKAYDYRAQDCRKPERFGERNRLARFLAWFRRQPRETANCS